jgi:hypothetical protein
MGEWGGCAPLGLVVQRAAGVPPFTEQKKILEPSSGLFYDCAQGAEAKRFNRLLIDAGRIKNL